jgi:AraC-like DNA-binding protein
MLYISGVVISFFLAIIIFTKRERNLSDILLGIWMVFIGIHVLSYYGFISGFYSENPEFFGFVIPLPYLHGPLLFLYTLSLTNPSKLKGKSWLIHLILPLVSIMIYMPFIISSHAEKLEMLNNKGKGYEDNILISGWLLNISGILYVVFNFRLLQKHQQRILDQFSNQEKINLNWLRFLYYVMAGMWILIIFIQNDQLIFSASSVFVILIGYFGIRQVGIFTNKTPDVFENEENNALNDILFSETTFEKRKYAKSGLNDDTARELHQKLQTLMEKEKLYLEAELTLSDLAKNLDIHPNYLSQIINEIEGVNFYDYINRLRVEEFKRLVVLPESQKFTLLAVAYECGFNSKSAFNRVFKKETN